jgi:hypothetical protein
MALWSKLEIIRCFSAQIDPVRYMLGRRESYEFKMFYFLTEMTHNMVHECR